MNNDFYYFAEIVDIDGLKTVVIVKDKDLGDFMTNFDNKNYQLMSVYGVGQVGLDYKDFTKKEPSLETGDKGGNKNVDK